MNIEQYLEENFIKFEKLINNIFLIEGLGKCIFIEHKDGKIFDDSLNILFSEDEERSVYEDNIDYLIFQFGNNFFYSNIDISSKFELHSLRYIGQADTDDPFNYPFLGIHGKYELLNGCFDYELWCKKANFLNIQTLGICEKNTLAGTLPFQIECEKNKIKPILGETVTVKLQTREQFDLKLYVVNEIGWKNLIQINSLINLEEIGKFIELDNLLLLGEGLIAVIDPFSFILNKQIVNNLYTAFDKVYYQIDSVICLDDNTDKTYLTNLKQFVSSKLNPILINDAYYLDKNDAVLKNTLNSITSVVSPITKDQYFKTYLENEKILIPLFKDEGKYFDFIEKSIDSLFEVEELCEFTINTKDKYLPEYERKGDEITRYKSNEELFLTLLEKGLREKNLQQNEFYKERLEEEIEVIKEGGFIDYFLILWDIFNYCRDNQILTGLGRGCFLPVINKVLTNKGLVSIEDVCIGDMVEGKSGINEVINKFCYDIEEDVYEIELENGNVVIATDNHKFCLEDGSYVEAQYLTLNSYLKKLGQKKIQIRSIKKRPYQGKVYDLQVANDPSYNVNGVIVHNSAAGSLISYLLNITTVDPIEYGLLFSRFLNRGRMKKSFPDIDSDVDSNRKDEVKKYIENRYGADRVCSMGTYTTLQLKAAIQDLSRQKRIPIDTVRYLSAVLDFEKNDPTWEDLMIEAAKKPFVKNFVVENTDIVENIQLCLGQPKAASVHACAMLILPKGQSIYNTIPIRTGIVNGQKILVSEWEGEYLEKAGYLKEDILGIKQLTKFQMIKDLVKRDLGEDVDIYNIPYDQPEVFDLFRRGLSGDVFHLGSKGLTQYALEVQPENIRDLIAMLALYRPGPMENGFHKEYIERKSGKKPTEYDFGTEEITKDTYGILIFQEQVMRVCTDLGGFTMVEADDIRKAMGKKQLDLLEESKDKFIKGAVKNGCPEENANNLWEKMEKFAKYCFNLSHATCYALTGYICQYLKWKYPVQYWTTAFQFANDAAISEYIAEISKKGDIKVVPVDVNVSNINFTPSNEKREIYWSISKVKQCGEIATQAILEERDTNGQFFSFEEFLSRMSKEVDGKVQKLANKLVIENLIFAGAFDNLENIEKPIDRLRLLNEYRKSIGLKKDNSVRDKEIQKAIDSGMVTCDWWWTLFQKRVSGYAFFDYRSLIFDDNDTWENYDYMPLDEVLLGEWESYVKTDYDGVARASNVFAGVIQEIDIRTDSKGNEFARLMIENNYSKCWFYVKRGDAWQKFKNYITGCGKGNIFIGNGSPVYNQWMNSNVVQCADDFDCEILMLFENEDKTERTLDISEEYVDERISEEGVLDYD